ncbi:ferrous iron transport protein B [Campylobacter hyointestinalis]|uniref:ferrous iron transport protein B n=1 Tax=Campylobacter hyointestinalis TaxID=198 RepID=UPI0004D8AF1E|nr:ferrous iron transport protein B [Campylobacter hyointestinalis]ANE32939.1 ferrous iron transport protein B [Campylobacter hyointestinalis subsp. hyointestinalis LMG 9260]KEA43942.1 ferrous iron transporter B [Campylobacter hyointestinalis subsp. hyointestinalis]QKF56109.1 ferrous iron transport protein B [Campylobacter hyointestinalis subsp. hyointestinalis]TXK47051.1 ferrous iron transport protein B [Campylobacter hyointestinalis]SFT63125.1 ferrous iron transport protein B [Campylobacter 
MKKEFIVALVGQPNVGKSQLLSSISGANPKIGNFAGVTVDKYEATLVKGDIILNFIDLPGLYSLDDFSKDESVAKDFLMKSKYDMILNVVDSTNLERNLFLTSELMALGKKMVVALNMDDEAKSEGVEIDDKQLSSILNIPAVKVSSVKKTNFSNLLDTIIDVLSKPYTPNKLKFSDQIEEELIYLAQKIDEANFKKDEICSRQAAILFLLEDKKFYTMSHEDPKMLFLIPEIKKVFDNIKQKTQNSSIEDVLIDEYHSFAKGAALETQNIKAGKSTDITKKIDSILIHRFFGLPIFLFFMWLLFQATFTLGEVPMQYIEMVFAWFGDSVAANLNDDMLKSIIVDGIIAGVGTVILFLPNIIILFLGIALLETTGYMARVAFLLDGFFHKFGLHGKSFIPLVTGFGCSIPAYMAARTLKSQKDRLLTMFIIGFMSCGARLPVYVLFAGAFFKPENAGNVLFFIYISGALLGLIAAKVLRIFVFKGNDEPFVMEMPKYRLPSVKLIWLTIYSKSMMYLKKAGTFILAASILVWFVSTFPQNPNIEEKYQQQIQAASSDELKLELTHQKDQELMENTYLGMFGKAIEPVFAPLGFNWKMSVATVSGLAAKEVIVSTLGVLYSLGGEVSENNTTLQQTLAKNIPFASAMAFIVFVMVYLPCLAATAVFSKEAESKKYTFYLITFTFCTAWVLSFATYKVIVFLNIT